MMLSTTPDRRTRLREVLCRGEAAPTMIGELPLELVTDRPWDNHVPVWDATPGLDLLPGSISLNVMQQRGES